MWIQILFGINLGLFFWFYFTDGYPFFLVIINILSLLIITFKILRNISIHTFLKTHTVDVAIIFLLCILAFVIRIYKVDTITPGMWGDEVGYAKIGERLVDAKKFVPFSDDLFAPPTPFLYLVGFTVQTFGRTLVTVRLWGIIFGALCVPALYMLLRTLLTRKFALPGSALLLVLYHHIIISRFAYEMSAGVFFEILTMTFLILLSKTKRIEYVYATALSLAGAMYTYLAFRTHAVFVIGILAFVIWREKEILIHKVRNFSVFCIILFIALVPWISFSVRHPAHVMARAKAISVFHQNLPSQEVLKEIWGSTKLSLGMFLFTGDPNPRQNPSQQTMYDILIVCMSVVGCIYLFRKNKPLGIALIFLMIPSFINDIFSIELIPEFHYYGTGHPSATRTLGLIPIMMVFCSFGYYALYQFMERMKFAEPIRIFILILLIGGSMYFNWSWYYAQPPSRYLYEANEVRRIDAALFANHAAKLGEKTIAISKSLLDDQRVSYFIDKSLIVIPLDIKNTETSIDVIPRQVYTIFDTRTAKALDAFLINPQFVKDQSLIIRAIPTQWPEVDTLIIYRP
jgi:hypothetical protein